MFLLNTDEGQNHLLDKIWSGHTHGHIADLTSEMKNVKWNNENKQELQ